MNDLMLPKCFSLLRLLSIERGLSMHVSHTVLYNYRSTQYLYKLMNCMKLLSNAVI